MNRIDVAIGEELDYLAKEVNLSRKLITENKITFLSDHDFRILIKNEYEKIRDGFNENLNLLQAIRLMMDGKKFYRIKRNGQKGCVYELCKTVGNSWNIYKNGKSTSQMNFSEILSEYQLIEEKKQTR